MLLQSPVRRRLICDSRSSATAPGAAGHSQHAPSSSRFFVTTPLASSGQPLHLGHRLGRRSRARSIPVPGDGSRKLGVDGGCANPSRVTASDDVPAVNDTPEDGGPRVSDPPPHTQHIRLAEKSTSSSELHREETSRGSGHALSDAPRAPLAESIQPLTICSVATRTGKARRRIETSRIVVYSPHTQQGATGARTRSLLLFR